MKKLLLPLLALAICCSSLHAQYYFYNDRYYENAVVVELGGSFGVMNSLTDLGGKKGVGKGFIKDLRWKTATPTGSVHVTGMYKNAIAARLELTFGSVKGFDSILKNVSSLFTGRYERNLSFKSKIMELQLAAEIHPLYILKFDPDNPPPVSPYAVVGIGYFNFNPQANLDGQWINLQPLHTEGQGFREYRDRQPYKLSQFNITAGMGVKYELNSFANLRLEVLHRFLNTDYLDDVSTTYIDPSLFDKYLSPNLAYFAAQLNNRKRELNPADETMPGEKRGDPKGNDAFFTIQLKIGVVIGRQRR